MKIIISNNYEAMSEKAYEDIVAIMQAASKPLICVASGDSPSGIYKNIVKGVGSNEINIDSWSFLGLDEWVGLNGDDEGSCRYHLNRELFNPLAIPANRICFFDGAASDLEQQCSITENTIQAKGGIEMAILGLGMNGHIVLIVSGSKKAGIVKEVMEGPISEAVPASLLRNHPNCSIYLDEAAAAALK